METKPLLMDFLKRLDRLVFIILLAGVAFLGWKIFGRKWAEYREVGQSMELIRNTGPSLNEARKELHLSQVPESFVPSVHTELEGFSVRWATPESSLKPYFQAKEIYLRNNKRYQETDTYVFPLRPKGSHHLYYDFFPDSLPDRRFRARLELYGLQTIHSFELPQSREARQLRDSLLTEWRIPLP